MNRLSHLLRDDGQRSVLEADRIVGFQFAVFDIDAGGCAAEIGDAGFYTLTGASGMAGTAETLWSVGEAVYPIYELAPSQLPNLHDGTLEEWDEALPHASLYHSDVGASIDMIP